jgi:hypothetical protein
MTARGNLLPADAWAPVGWHPSSIPPQLITTVCKYGYLVLFEMYGYQKCANNY